MASRVSSQVKWCIKCRAEVEQSKKHCPECHSESFYHIPQHSEKSIKESLHSNTPGWKLRGLISGELLDTETNVSKTNVSNKLTCNCGIPLTESGNSCLRCGREVPAQRMALISGNQENEDVTKEKSNCLKCGESVNAIQKFCGNCGEKLNWPTLSSSHLSQQTSAEDESANLSPKTTQDLGNKEHIFTNLKWAFAILVFIGLIFAVANRTGSGYSQNTTGSIYSATDACQDISTILYDYFNEFEEFRYGVDDGTGWAPLKMLTQRATNRIDESIRKMRNGITWDSFAITSRMLSAASSYMTEILDSAERGFFSPGRDLEALFQEIEINLTSVVNSACN